MDESQQNERNAERELKASPKLAQALRSLQKESIFIPPQVDEVVLKSVQPHLAQIKKPKAVWNKTNRILAMAAAFVLAGFVTITLLNSRGSGPRNFAREDLNHDGRVDILDAFQLARELKSGKAQNLDLNADGHTDASDVEVIARRSVNLEKGGHS
jgi:Dockerin type I domain